MSNWKSKTLKIFQAKEKNLSRNSLKNLKLIRLKRLMEMLCKSRHMIKKNQHQSILIKLIKIPMKNSKKNLVKNCQATLEKEV
jgi:hypothetical protein